MTYADRRAKGAPIEEPTDLYSRIRKEQTEEMLRTGKCWLTVVRGIPTFLVNADDAYDSAEWILRNIPKEDIVKIKYKNMLSGKEFTVEEIHSTIKRV